MDPTGTRADTPKSSTELAAERTDMAVDRTLMAADRTLMAWVRTGLSMQSFGFAIYKFLLYVRESLSKDVFQAKGPRRFGIVLMALGTMSLLFGLIDHYRTYRRVGRASGPSPWNFAFFIAVSLALLGMFLVITILIHRDVF